MALCTISGYLYDCAGNIVKSGKLTLRLQQDMVSPDGDKIAPVVISQLLTPLQGPTELGVANIGTPGTSTNYYEVTSVDGNGGESLPSPVVTTTTAPSTLNGTNYNRISWTPEVGAALYNIYGRGSSSGSRVLLGSTTQSFYDDQGSAIGTAKPTENESGGYIHVTVVPTIGASPSGVSYLVEYDPDPDDQSVPARNKDGYWHNYWQVPNQPSVAVGNFVSALRGQPSNNYLPIGATISSLGNLIALGSAANANKRIQAPQASFTPELRFNTSSGKWELSNDGVTFDAINVDSVIGDITSIVAGTGLTGGGSSGTVNLAVTGLTNNEIASGAAIAWTKMESATIPTNRLPVDGTSIVINGSGQLAAGGDASASWVPGDIKITAKASPDSGWLVCDGSAKSRTTYASLFAAIGTTYGAGDGTTTFNLPDLRQRFPLGKAASGTGSTLGSTGGAIDHTHTHSGIPNHTHPVTVSDPGHGHTVWADTGGGSNVGVSLFGFTDEQRAPGGGTSGGPIINNTTGITAVTGNPTGGVSSVTSSSNNPPFLALTFVIKY